MAAQSSAEARKSSVSGRGLFATKDIQPGDVIVALDRPLIAALDQTRIEDTCSWCFSWTELPVLSGAGINQTLKVNWCTGCKKVKYCSKNCQSRAWKAGHKQHCKRFSAQAEAIPSTVLAVMQILEGLNSGDDIFKEIQKMETHRDSLEKLGFQKWDAMQLMAHTAVKLAGEKDSQANLERGKMAMCAVMCNTSRLVTPTFDPLGLALDPRTSVINHSCSPNSVIVFDGPKMSVRALDKILKDDEVFISYIDSSAPYGVRQAELKDQYFFTCACANCKLGLDAPQDAFLKTSEDFEERIKVIDEMIPQLANDPAWPRHRLGESTELTRLSALQFYAYAYLNSSDVEKSQSPEDFRKAITILRNTGMWPITRAPMPALLHQYAVACLGARKYNEALIALLRLHTLVDAVIYPQSHHPVRIVHAWTLATLAKAVSGDEDSLFCKALQARGIDLPFLFLALLAEIHEQVSLSHGSKSAFGRTVEQTWVSIMGPGGELDVQYQQLGVPRSQHQRILQENIQALWPKVKAFAADDATAAQIDGALAE